MELDHIITSLKQSEHYRVIEKYKKPEYYHPDDGCTKRVGVYIDVETTGFDHVRNKVIELGLVCFEYSEDGRIFSIVEEYSAYQDPGTSIPTEITELTGITDEMVKGHKIDTSKVNEYIRKADIIIAHNAAFDRKFVERTIPNLEKKPWACSAKDVSWKKEGIESPKLEYIAYRCGFFYEGHRAVADCLAGVQVLSHKLPKSGQYAMQDLLANASKCFIKLYAVKAPFEHKDILKSRGYKWLYFKEANTQAWCIELPQDLIEREIKFLREEIYYNNVKLPFEIIDGHNRFTTLDFEIDKEKHRDLIDWIRSL